MLEQWKGLRDTPYPLDPDTAAAVSAALRNGVTSFAVGFEITNRKSNDLAGQVAYDTKSHRRASASG